jgi:hypothetical protein
MLFVEGNLKDHWMWSTNQGFESSNQRTHVDTFKQVLFCSIETQRTDKIEWLEILVYHAYMDHDFSFGSLMN